MTTPDARAAAMADLSDMVGASSRPTFTVAQVERLLDAHRVTDPDGRRVSDPGYTATWDLNAAAAEGWRRKAAFVAGDFTFSADDARYDKGAVLANCEAMVALYVARMGPQVLRSQTSSYAWETDRLNMNG